MTGYIKNIVSERGFGFIAESDGPDIFFHCSELDPSLDFDETLVNRRVMFDTAMRPKGFQAVNIRAAH